MRLCTLVSLGLAAAVTVLPGAAPAYAQTPLPACAPEEDHTFPLTARIHGGPASYPAGGGFGTWRLELTNTTGRTCTGIHPVVVLVDEKRALRPAQPQLEFYDGRRPHPVRFEATDQDELVGVFAAEDAGFPGFTVGAGKTLSVKVRLALTSDAVANEVTANAAVVQRRENDGDWVGQSNDYRFRIDHATPPEPPSTSQSQPDKDKDKDDGTGTDEGPGTGTDTGPGTGTDPGTDTGTDPGARPDRRSGGLNDGLPDELAATGPGRAPVLAAATAAASAASLLTGALAVLLSRRRR
ncbi:hypothetical protein [Streptomyces calvus]|uniref:hypothetical protein n=1 Tax=Streptomyces calvus TaxID=67282 RepID=UPI00370FD33C